LPEIKSKNEIYELNEGLKSAVAAMQFLQEKAEENEKKTVKTPIKAVKGKRK